MRGAQWLLTGLARRPRQRQQILSAAAAQQPHRPDRCQLPALVVTTTNAAMSSRIAPMAPMIPPRFAPFIQFCPLNCYEWFKLVLLLPFAIVRILLLVLLLLFWAFCCTIGLCCVGEIAAGEPLPEGRRDCIGAVSRCLAAAAMLLMGCWVTVEGTVPQDRPPIGACPCLMHCPSRRRAKPLLARLNRAVSERQ